MIPYGRQDVRPDDVVAVVELVQDIGIEDKDRQHGQSRAQVVVKADVVVQSQVAAEPEDDRFGGHAGELRDNLRSSLQSAT